jgi:hypothetical protein
MALLTVISGPANSGKMPLALALLKARSAALLIHRDRIREVVVHAIDEPHLTCLMADMTACLLRFGHDVIAVAQNLFDSDQQLWERISNDACADLQWFDTRDPAVHVLIPPLEGWTPLTKIKESKG